MENDKRILCVGMCVLDIIHVCETYPEEDTDKRCIRGHWQRGGNASNNCTVLAQLKAPCEFLGVLSNSTAFQFLQKDCNKRNIFVNNCPTVDLDPPFSSVILNQLNGSRTIIHSNPDFPILKCNDFQKINLFLYKWIHFEARNLDEVQCMIEHIICHNIRAPADTITISIELEKMDPKLLLLTEKVDFIFLGKDLALFLKWNNAKESVYGLRDKITNKNATIFCPWGELGCGILDSSNNYIHVNSVPPKNIVDTLGAGDTFCAGTIFKLSQGQSCKEAVEFGNRLAGFKISFYGYDKINELQYL